MYEYDGHVLQIYGTFTWLQHFHLNGVGIDGIVLIVFIDDDYNETEIVIFSSI